MKKQLLEKYDVAAPRYTSYPTVPQWEGPPTQSEWFSSINKAFFSPESSWSMYIHIPFCESLCTYCGCTQTITKNHKKAENYIELVHKEWDNYLKNSPLLKQRPLKTLHLGGGTPTFFSAEALEKLLAPILKKTVRENGHFEGAIEVDPRRTNGEQLLALHKLGFRRVSLGVQDFNEEVQRLINRVQPESLTEGITHSARSIGYESVNFDLIYGLPKQTLDRMKLTVEKTLRMRPDRIALYSLALVPWIKPAQRLFQESDLPQGEEKRALYEYARDTFLENGYIEIGMDHFALPTDSMAQSFGNKKLHRNFMGYTTDRSDVLVGLGASAISETPESFSQNHKDLKTYENAVNLGVLPANKGHRLNEEDRRRRQQIIEFMVRQEVELDDSKQSNHVSSYLEPMINDGLVSVESNKLILNEEGRPFLRNACMALDERLRRAKPDSSAHSKAI